MASNTRPKCALPLHLLALWLAACGGLTTDKASLAPSFAYPKPAWHFTVGTPIGTVAPGNSGGVSTSWSIAPALPPGLFFSNSTGQLNGTPTAPSPATTYVVTAANANGSATATLSIVVDPLAPALSFAQAAYRFVMGAPVAPLVPHNSGGAPASWSIAPALPPALSFSLTSGQLSGTPTVVSPPTVYTVTATNVTGSGTATVSIAVNPAAPAISYPQAAYVFTAGVGVAAVIPASSGGAVDAWTISPALPAGLSFDANSGQLTGTPTATSPAALYTVTASNVTGSATATLTLTVNPAAPAISFTPGSYVFTAGTAITPVSPASTGGAVASWSIAPALSAGLSLNASSGLLAGTPTATSPATSYTVTATNLTGSATAVLSIAVAAAPPVFNYSPQSYVFTAGVAIGAVSPASSGGPVSSWSITPALPSGLLFNTASGQVSGTPAAVSAATTYTVTGTNGTGSSTATLSISVNPAAPAIGYSQQAYLFTAGTAITPLTPSNAGGAASSWSIAPTLPAGLSFSTASGLVAGTPSGVGATTSYTVTATNVTGSATATFSITVNPAAPQITYPQASYVFVVGAAIAPITPVNAGGAATTWSISPALSAGLTFNTSTGQITGTPTATRTSTLHTGSAANVTGSATASLAIAVQYKLVNLYESGLGAPWVRDTWGAVTTNLAAPVPAGHAGTAALEASYTASYSALVLRQPAVGGDPPQLNEARTIELDIYFVPGSRAPDLLELDVNDAGLSDAPTVVSLIPGWATKTTAQKFGVWHHINVDLASIHPVRQDVSALILFARDLSGIHFVLQSVHLGYQDRTTPPALTLGPLQLAPDYTQLAIPFSSDEGVLWHLDYGVGGYQGTVQGPADYAFSGTSTLTGLTPGTTLQYRLVGTDHHIDPGSPPNTATLMGTYLLPPKPTVPPVISNVAVSAISADSALLGFACSRVCSAVATAQRAGGPVLTRRTTSLATPQSLPLDLLEAQTLYQVSLTVTDAFNLSSSTSTSFTTGATSTPTVTISVDPASAHPISPYIYGNNFHQPSGSNLIGGLAYQSPPRNLTLDRWGGNRWTAYNWETNASNAGSDYLYSSDSYLASPLSTGPAGSLQAVIAADQAAGMASLVTVQLQGYVAADTAGPVATPFPNLARFKSVVYAKGSAFTATPSTTDASVYMDEFLWALRGKFSGDIFAANAALPTFVSLDNEPDLWWETHQEIQGSTQPTASAFITKSVALAKAVRAVAPAAKVFGPAISGWYGFEAWNGDPAYGLTHWFIDDYLAQMKSASVVAGARLLDVLDYHWYAQVTTAAGATVSSLRGSTLTDEQIQVIVQAPRSLWDHTYKENSWIANDVLGGPIYALDRLQARIDANYPGTPMAITEYDNGGYHHIAGAIAQADNLGIFGLKGLFAATYWSQDDSTLPNAAAFVMAGFKAYRDFDGNKASFGDVSFATTSSDTAKVSAYVSRDSQRAGRYVLVALNRSSTSQSVAFSGLPVSGTAYVYRLDGSADPLSPAPALVGQVPVDLSGWVVTLPAYSVNTIEVR